MGGGSVPSRASIPPQIPQRPSTANNNVSNATAVPTTPSSAVGDADDPYGQLVDLDSGNGGGYETDVPRPRGAEEDLLF